MTVLSLTTITLTHAHRTYQQLAPESRPVVGVLEEGGFVKKIRKSKKKYCGEKLTKKEKKGKGSNWEAMKGKF